MFEVSVFVMVGILVFLVGFGVGMEKERRHSDRRAKLMRRWLNLKATDGAGPRV
jgi:hypothetical protein